MYRDAVTQPSRLLPLLLALSGCTKPSAATTPPAAQTAETGPQVPDDAIALVDDQPVPRRGFDEALARYAGSGPASRDDRGLQQRVLVAALTGALVQRELAALQLGDAAQLEQRVAPLRAALALVATPTGNAALPSWWARPPLSDEDHTAAIAVAAAIAGEQVPEDAIAAAYQAQGDRWSSDSPWVRVDVWTLRYDDDVGVDACDEYVAKYRRCTESMPAATRPTVLADLSRQAGAWRAAAQDAERAPMVATECEAAATEAMQSTQPLGCDWGSDAGAAEKRARATMRGNTRATAEQARARLAAGEALLALAQGAAQVQPRHLLTLDELPKKAAKAVRNAKPGTTTAAIDDGHAWIVLRVIESHGKGALPLEAAREDVAAELRTARVADALAQLPETLRARHRVELHPALQDIDAARGETAH